jgi:mRNA-degrading endonuclease RelE of RelBE toxin-antitoxin system
LQPTASRRHLVLNARALCRSRRLKRAVGQHFSSTMAAWQNPLLLRKSQNLAIIEPMFEIELAHSARQDLKALRKYEQQIILDGIQDQLQFEPTVATANRKQMEPNNIADWELRLGRYRVFYDVEEQTNIVLIQATGFKIGGELYIRGERREV